MKSVSVLMKLLTEILKGLHEEERNFLINKVYELLQDHGSLDDDRRHNLEVKFQALVEDVRKIKESKHSTLDQALSVLSDKYTEFLKHDNLTFDFKNN